MPLVKAVPPVKDMIMDNKITTNVTAVQIANFVHDGDEFVLATRSRQSDEFKIYGSGDEQQTHQTLKTAERQAATQPA